MQYTSHDRPPHALFTTDSLDTQNAAGDEGLEKGTSPYYNINTGIYFVKQVYKERVQQFMLETWDCLVADGRKGPSLKLSGFIFLRVLLLD